MGQSCGPWSGAALLWTSSPASASGLAGRPEKQELQLFLGRPAASHCVLWGGICRGAVPSSHAFVPAPRMGPHSHLLTEQVTFWCDIFPSVPGQRYPVQGQGHSAACFLLCARNSAGSGTSLEGLSPVLSWCCQTLAIQGLRLTALPAHPVGFLSHSVQSTEK